MKNALLVTQNVDARTDGDVDPFRPIARLKVENETTDAARLPRATPDVISAFRSTPQRFEGLESAAATMRRKLYFSEDNTDEKFFITVDGEIPKLFDPDAPRQSSPHRVRWKTGSSRTAPWKITSFTCIRSISF